MSIVEYLAKKTYPGRTICVYTDKEVEKLHFIYFIMGRSANSQNRIFVYKNNEVRTQAFDESKIEDPSLIIYPVYKSHNGVHMLTNGDQTQTISDGLQNGIAPEKALLTRDFEPDAPNFTPRISAVFDGNSYALNIIKSCDEQGTDSVHFHYQYPLLSGKGHCIHTYVDDGNPLPSFCGEPFAFDFEENLPERIWEGINPEFKISLLHLTVDIQTRTLSDYQIFNKHEME